MHLVSKPKSKGFTAFAESNAGVFARRLGLPHVCMFLIVAAVFVTNASAEKKANPPTTKELIAVWIGFDDDELTFTRLDLRSDGQGFCARVSPADTILHDYGVQVYRVASWSVDGWILKIQLTPLSPNAEPVYLKGRYRLASLRLEIGAKKKWKMGLLLRPEKRITSANEEAKAAINRADQ